MAGELQALKEAARGLLYPSESDEPIEVMSWNAAPRFADQPVREQSVGDFFAELEEGEEGEKFCALRKALQRELTEIKVYRVGTIRVDVYVVGKTPGNAWAGLHMVSVET